MSEEERKFARLWHIRLWQSFETDTKHLLCRRWRDQKSTRENQTIFPDGHREHFCSRELYLKTQLMETLAVFLDSAHSLQLCAAEQRQSKRQPSRQSTQVGLPENLPRVIFAAAQCSLEPSFGICPQNPIVNSCSCAVSVNSPPDMQGQESHEKPRKEKVFAFESWETLM